MEAQLKAPNFPERSRQYGTEGFKEGPLIIIFPSQVKMLWPIGRGTLNYPHMVPRKSQSLRNCSSDRGSFYRKGDVSIPHSEEYIHAYRIDFFDQILVFISKNEHSMRFY